MSRKKTILLVEDDEFLAELYATKLKLEGYDVILATDGERGYKLANEKNPDLILLDIILPKMDGFEILKKLKTQNKTKSLPIILLTNLSQKDEVKRGLDLGADDYLIKAHFMPSEVILKIKKILKETV